MCFDVHCIAFIPVLCRRGVEIGEGGESGVALGWSLDWEMGRWERGGS